MCVMRGVLLQAKGDVAADGRFTLLAAAVARWGVACVGPLWKQVSSRTHVGVDALCGALLLLKAGSHRLYQGRGGASFVRCTG